MIRRLDVFVQMLGSELHRAQAATHRVWPGTRVASMQVAMAATVERVDGLNALALRIGRAPQGTASVHELCIEVPGEGAEDITVRIDGHLFARYRGHGDDQAC